MSDWESEIDRAWVCSMAWGRGPVALHGTRHDADPYMLAATGARAHLIVWVSLKRRD